MRSRGRLLRVGLIGAVVAGLLTGSLVLVLGTSAPQASIGRDPDPAIVDLRTAGGGALFVRWTDLDGVDRYRVTVAGQDAEPVVTTFRDAEGVVEDLAPGREYSVTVEAVASEGERARRTEPETVRVPWPAPAGVEATTPRPNRVKVVWDAVDGAPGYVVSYARDPEMSDARTVESAEPKVRLDEDIALDTTYWVSVAVDGEPEAASEPVEVTTPGAVPVDVGSFNVYGVNNDTKRPAGAQPWRQRREVVARQIAESDLDVVGLQELNQASSYSGRVDVGPNQMTDLRAAMQRRDASWDLVNDLPYNCRRHWTPTRCAEADRGASNGTRILYRRDRLEVLSSGTVRYGVQNDHHRYLAWAVMRPRDGGEDFFFATTHLQHGRTGSDNRTRTAQWRQLIAEVTARAGGRPVIVTGDFNTSRNQVPAGMFADMRAAGFGEVLGTEAGVNPPRGVRAQEVVRGDIGSYNGFKRSLRAGGSCYCGSPTKTGNSLDFVFASNALEIARYELVADLDAGYNLTGTIPSDHHLVTARVMVAPLSD